MASMMDAACSPGRSPVQRHCFKEEIPVVGHLVHFLPFWEEVIQADRWVLEIIRYGYSIELI